MLLAILFLPLVAAIPLDTPSNNYVLDIENGTLKNVQVTGGSFTALDLSNMQIHGLEKNAFDSLPGLKSLNLSRNSLDSLPDFLFSNLTNLEYLSLAENQISSVKYLFVGLERLRVLNISRNPVAHLRRGDLFGLTKSTKIVTEGNVFWSISTGVFANAFLKDEEETKHLEPINEAKDDKRKDEEGGEKPVDVEGETKSSKVLRKGQRVKLCVSDHIVTSLEVLEKGQKVSEPCSELAVDHVERRVSLGGLGIKGFQEGWYRLESLPIATLDLSNNEISEVTRETLNDLPAGLVYVNLVGNRISRVWKQVIESQHLKVLNLKDNLIVDIEEDAFEKTKLNGLILTGNQLKNLNFVRTLPPTLTEFVSTNNHITSIPDGAFYRLSRLVYLNLGNNQIARLQNNVFRGLDNLQVLILTRNSLTRIEARAFDELKQLRTLYLYRNSLSDLEKGTFSELQSLKDLNLAWNGITRITKDTFADLPKALDFLHLDFNEIGTLENGSYVDVPRFTLSLNGNKLSSIERGAFNLPTLRDLHLNNNTLDTMDGDSFEGLPQLKRLWLSENRIAEIHKGSCKNLGTLHVLDISKNPFQRLRNGALYGLSSARGNFVYIYNNQLTELEAAVFDDV